MTILIFLAVLAVLVLAHELGHFLAARASGVKVEEFGFGFPPRLFGVQLFRRQRLEKVAEKETVELEISSGQNLAGEKIIEEKITDRVTEIDQLREEKKWRWVLGNGDFSRVSGEAGGREGTVYSFNLIPLGGFVKIKGEDEEDWSADSFNSQSGWKKTLIITSGVIMNVVLAAVLFSVGYLVGLPSLTDKIADESVIKDRRLEIIQVLPGKPAEQAGLQAGDAIVGLGALFNPRLTAMQDYVNAHRSEEISVTVLRGEETLTKKITPIVYEGTGRGGIGVGIAEFGTVKYPWYLAFYHGSKDCVIYIKDIFVAFYDLIKGLFQGRGAADAVSGPVGIAVMTGQAARLGLLYLMQFVAVLSLNLAVVNILPIPALDGGRLLLYGIGRIVRRRSFVRFERTAHAIGFALLMLLVAVITVNDIGHFKGIFVNFWDKIF